MPVVLMQLLIVFYVTSLSFLGQWVTSLSWRNSILATTNLSPWWVAHALVMCVCQLSVLLSSIQPTVVGSLESLCELWLDSNTINSIPEVSTSCPGWAAECMEHSSTSIIVLFTQSLVFYTHSPLPPLHTHTYTAATYNIAIATASTSMHLLRSLLIH